MICGCVLPYTNPDACKHCLAARQDLGQEALSAHEPGKLKKKAGFYFPKNGDYQIIIKTKKITEIFDKDGTLVKRIVEEGTN